jgi:hypothetical protein
MLSISEVFPVTKGSISVTKRPSRGASAAKPSWRSPALAEKASRFLPVYRVEVFRLG